MNRRPEKASAPPIFQMHLLSNLTAYNCIKPKELKRSKHSASFSNIKVLCQNSREKEILRNILEKELMNLEELLFPKIGHWRLYKD